MRRHTVWPIAPALLAGLVACAPLSTPHVAPSPFERGASLGISPLAHAPYAGSSIPLELIGTDARRGSGTTMWTAQPLRRAWVTSDGVAHLFEPGPVRLIARRGDVVAITELEIRPNPVVEVFAERSYGGPVFPGDSIRISARAVDGDGREVDDVRLAFALDVRGSDRITARVTPAGVFVADRPGLYTVLVESNGRAATVPVLVRASSAIARRTYARVASSQLDSAARVAPRLAPVLVRPGRTRRVKIRSMEHTAYTGTSQRLEARVWMDDSRSPDTTAEVSWSSSDTSIAIIDVDGFVSFRRHGWVKLTARHGDARDTRRLLVRRNLAAHMVLQSSAHYPRVGQRVRLTEEAWAYGAIRIPHARAYFGIVSHDDSVPAASISDDRDFVATEPGAYTVIAVLGGRASRTTFVVYPSGARCELGLRKWDPSCRK